MAKWARDTKEEVSFDFTNLRVQFHSVPNLKKDNIDFKVCVHLPIAGKSPLVYEMLVSDVLSGEEMAVIYDMMQKVANEALKKSDFHPSAD